MSSRIYILQIMLWHQSLKSIHYGTLLIFQSQKATDLRVKGCLLSHPLPPGFTPLLHISLHDVIHECLILIYLQPVKYFFRITVKFYASNMLNKILVLSSEFYICIIIFMGTPTLCEDLYLRFLGQIS